MAGHILWDTPRDTMMNRTWLMSSKSWCCKLLSTATSEFPVRINFDGLGIYGLRPYHLPTWVSPESVSLDLGTDTVALGKSMICSPSKNHIHMEFGKVQFHKERFQFAMYSLWGCKETDTTE